MNEQEFTLYEKNGSIFSIGMEFKNLLSEYFYEKEKFESSFKIFIENTNTITVHLF